MNMKDCEQCGGRFEAARGDARFCSARCRQRSHRGRPASGNMTAGVAASGGFESLLAAVDDLCTRLDAEGHLAGHETLAETARLLAVALDGDPRSSGLWAQFRAADEQLRGLWPAKSESDYFEVMRELQEAAASHRERNWHTSMAEVNPLHARW